VKVTFKVCPTRLHFAGDLGRLIQFARLGVVCINLQELGKNWIEAMFLYRGPSVLISIASKPLGNVWRSYDDCLRCLFRNCLSGKPGWGVTVMGLFSPGVRVWAYFDTHEKNRSSGLWKYFGHLLYT